MKLASRFNTERLRVLVTGIDSFTGRHLKLRLEKAGFLVFGTTFTQSASTKMHICDIENKSQIAEIIKSVKPSYVIHLAGISYVGHSNSDDFYRINVLGTQNLLDALVQSELRFKKVILASSAAVYGNQDKEVLEESLCPKPVNHYGISKLAMEHLASTYFSTLPIIITRPFNYIGIGQSIHFVIPKIIKHYKSQSKVIELGNVNVSREFNSVDFICNAYLKLLMSDHESQIINLCTGRGVELQTILNLMNEISGYEIEVKINPNFIRENELKNLVGSTEKLDKIIGSERDSPIKETLEKMYFD